jgi:hypothetical protein
VSSYSSRRCTAPGAAPPPTPSPAHQRHHRFLLRDGAERGRPGGEVQPSFGHSRTRCGVTGKWTEKTNWMAVFRVLVCEPGTVHHDQADDQHIWKCCSLLNSQRNGEVVAGSQKRRVAQVTPSETRGRHLGAAVEFVSSPPPIRMNDIKVVVYSLANSGRRHPWELRFSHHLTAHSGHATFRYERVVRDRSAKSHGN